MEFIIFSRAEEEPSMEGDFPPSHCLVKRRFLGGQDLVLELGGLDGLKARRESHFRRYGYAEAGTIDVSEYTVVEALLDIKVHQSLKIKGRSLKVKVDALLNKS